MKSHFVSLSIIFIITFIFITNTEIHANPDKDLLNAVIKGDTNSARKAIDEGGDVNTVNEYDRSLLVIAITQRSPDLAMLLLDKGAIINSLSECHKSTLVYAAERGYLEVVKALLDRGAIVDNEALIAAMAVENSHEIAELLIAKGGDVNFKSERGITVLMMAASDANLDTVKLLIENGADVNIVNDNGNSALAYAVIKGNYEIAKFLIKKGAIVNPQRESVDNLLATPLMWAVIFGHDDILQLLIENGADINAKNKNGETALYLAEKLLESDADNKTIKENITPHEEWINPDKLKKIIHLLTKENNKDNGFCFIKAMRK